ncbi:MAG: efflux transporter outer membrane subunit [Burkholderiaceae bacterium]
MTDNTTKNPCRRAGTRFGAVAAAAIVAASLAGCADFSGISTSAQMTPAADVGLRDTPFVWPQERWWTQYGDPALDRLIDDALAQNPSIRLARARFAQAQAARSAAGAALLPQVGAGANVNRQRYTENGLFPPPLGGATLNDGAVNLNASYEFDVWGENRAAVSAAIRNAKAADAEAQSARVLIAASVAHGYFELARLIEERAVLEDTLAQREKVLSLVQQRQQAGLESNVELRQAEGTLPVIRADIAALDAQIAASRHALAALAGAGPEKTETLSPRIPTVDAPRLPDALPLDLLGRRAELAAARDRVEAALRGIDVARAQFYPNIDLTAFAGFSSIGLSRLFDASSRAYGIGPALRLPIFDAGRLRANLRGKSAEFDAAVESYNQALVDAVRDVSDQVSSLKALAVQQREQQAALATAESAYDLAQQRYRAGLSTFLTVLTAENAVLTQRRAATDLKARALELNVALNKALGGGFRDDAPLAMNTNR